MFSSGTSDGFEVALLNLNRLGSVSVSATVKAYSMPCSSLVTQFGISEIVGASFVTVAVMVSDAFTVVYVVVGEFALPYTPAPPVQLTKCCPKRIVAAMFTDVVGA